MQAILSAFFIGENNKVSGRPTANFDCYSGRVIIAYYNKVLSTKCEGFVFDVQSAQSNFT